MTNTLYRLDHPARTRLKEDIDLRRRGDTDRLLHLLLDQIHQTHTRIRNLKDLNIPIKREEDVRRRHLLQYHLHNQRMITVDTKGW